MSALRTPSRVSSDRLDSDGWARGRRSEPPAPALKKTATYAANRSTCTFPPTMPSAKGGQMTRAGTSHHGARSRRQVQIAAIRHRPHQARSSGVLGNARSGVRIGRSAGG